jgi:hypothetical protein
MIDLHPDQLRTFADELAARDPQFLRICSANAHDGQGVYECRLGVGTVSHRAFTFEDDRVLTPWFDAEARERLGGAPDAYAPGLAAMRAAATPDSFEAQYKARRLAALKAEYAKWAAERQS